MAFESYMHKPIHELELMKRICEEIQAHYLAYQNVYCFLKLTKSEGYASIIVDAKYFLDVYELGDYYFDTIFWRACIMVKFNKDKYEAICFGHHFSTGSYEVYPDKLIGGRILTVKKDRESVPMISRELLYKGFGEIEGNFKSAHRKKAM